MTNRQLVDRYNSMDWEERRRHLAKLTPRDLGEILNMADKGRARSATRILAEYGTRGREFTNDHREEILALLQFPDVKVRVNAAQIIGATMASECVEDLISALDAETVNYALPSYLLAVGNARNSRAETYLRNYQIRSDIDKHIREERLALKKARANFVRKETPHVRILPSDVIAVSTPNLEVTLQAFSRAGMKARKFGTYAAVSGLENFYKIYDVRAYDTAYLYLGSCPLAEMPDLLASREKAIIQRTQVKGFRLELANLPHRDRVAIIHRCLEKIKLLENTPNNYSIELLINVEDDTGRLFLNPLVDPRFRYRVETVPASIRPAVAACVMSYASDCFTEDARVLDDFCGAGTMLFERGYYPYSTLTGVDNKIEAIEAAAANSVHAVVHPQFYVSNALKFTGKRYNEIIANMPFGLRVGSHEVNERLYERYFQILPDILTDSGLAVLFTHEKKLTEQLLEGCDQLEMIRHTNFEAGGLSPTAYVMRRRIRSLA